MFVEDLGRGLPAEDLAGAVIECECDLSACGHRERDDDDGDPARRDDPCHSCRR